MCECCVNEDGTVEIEGRKVRYIDPLTDWGFKRLFGSEMNKEILLGFLQDLFPEKDIELIPNPDKALEWALDNGKDILVTGSFYLPPEMEKLRRAHES